MISPFVKILKWHALREMAGERSFARGQDYFSSGCVRSLVEYEGTITANVFGTRDYRVKLHSKNNELDYSCTCPVGADGAFCKHCVAVGLSWLKEKNASKPASKKSGKPAVTMDDVRACLAGRDKNDLVGMLMEQALDDERLRRRLFLETAKRSPAGFDVNAFREAISNAVDTRGFVDYGGARDYAQGIEEVIDSIEKLLKEGHAAEVIELAEYALEAVENAMGSIDDSDGHIGGVLERLQDMHHAACKKAKPEPKALAERLFKWELRAESDIFYGAAETYEDVLGEKGLAVYRKLAESEWARVPLLAPGRDDPEKYGKRWRITHIMETLARQSDDIEALVAIKSRDLSDAYDYLDIAETYKKAGKHEFALEWAERGLKAFPERTDERLREFLAEEYHRRSRHDEAMALIWAQFEDHPGLASFQTLKRHADHLPADLNASQAGIGRWPAWREKAISHMREHLAKEKRSARRDKWSWAAQAGHSELVKIFLWEKDIEAAWREAKEGGCSNDLWMELAARRKKDHPEDVLPIYQQQIGRTLDQKNNEAYKEAIRLLRDVRDLMARLDRETEFATYLESIRVAHKPKRNFMKFLDGAKWS